MTLQQCEAWQADARDWWGDLTKEERKAVMACYLDKYPGAPVSIEQCYDSFVAPMPEPPVTWGDDTV